MNKRQKEKRNNKLKMAIRELNNDILKDFNMPSITDEEVINTFNKIVKNRNAINQTLNHHKKYILKK